MLTNVICELIKRWRAAFIFIDIRYTGVYCLYEVCTLMR